MPKRQYNKGNKANRTNSKPQGQRGRQSRGQQREESSRNKGFELSEENDFTWHNHFPQFIKDAGTLAFGHPLGSVFTLPSTGGAFVAAGIMTLTFTPTIGYSADLNSPVNLSATRFQNYLRSIMKAAADYDAADTMMYMMSVDSLYMYHSLMRRAYETAQLYSPMNKYYPRRLLQAQGVNPSVANDLSKFRAYINKFAISLSSFPVPKNFDITSRHKWMCEGLYVDAAQSTRAQTYMFVPHLLWKFDNTVTTGSKLVPVYWRAKGSTVTQHDLDDIIAIGDQLIAAVINDQDMTNIAGDIWRAYGAGNCRTIEEVRDMDAIAPIYSEEVLSQIENATICGDFADNYTPEITQDPSVNNGAIIFKPIMASPAKLTGSAGYYAPRFANAGQFVNMHWDSPTPDQVIEATRFTACTMTPVEQGKTDPINIALTCFGADIINRTWIHVLGDDGLTLKTITNTSNDITFIALPGTTASVPVVYLENVGYQNEFDWAPFIYLNSVEGTSGAIDLDTIIGDVDNLTWVSASQLDNMHIADMFSLFDIPQVARS